MRFIRGRGSGSGDARSAEGDAGGGNQESATGKGRAFGGDARAEAEDRVSADLIGGNVAFEEAGSHWPRTLTSNTNTSRFAASAHITLLLAYMLTNQTQFPKTSSLLRRHSE